MPKQFHVREIEHQKRFLIYFGKADDKVDPDLGGWNIWRSDMMLADVERFVMWLNSQIQSST